MTNRVQKVNSLLKKEIGKIISKDFNFQNNLVTLTNVDASANLIEAKVYISVMPAENTAKIINTLNKGVHDIQQQINRMLFMRPIPKIKFAADEKIKEAARVEELLEKIKKTDIRE